MIENIARLFSQINVEIARLSALLPYATDEMRRIGQSVLERAKGHVDAEKFRWLTFDEESVPWTNEQKIQLKMWRENWIAIAQEQLKTLRMASDGIQQHFQQMHQFQLDMQRQFLDFLKRL